MKMHHDVTPERILEAMERSHSTLDSPGFCTACGLEADGVEPDAQRYKCESCGELAVYGAEELLLGLI
jgi:predicted RNA-binding Zn-ribbon protein involved in translation (DUF1610 family)